MIKAVIFDYFGVIATDAYWNDAHEMAELNGDSSKLHDLIEKMDTGELSWQKFCEDTGTLLGVSAKQVNKRAQEISANKQLIIFIEGLKKSGLKIGLLSNASSEYLLPTLKKAHIEHLFDHIVVSSDVGVSKPHPEIYKRLLGELGAEPYEAIFIDDMPSNVQGADNVGMHGVQFESNTQAIKQVERLISQF
jgi:putative hydrolase of the HAD superfamily